ncbi:Phosphate-specific transport system accessory protein PhoU [bioreactor metagenome]|uniref:Phosphate-specific transport system accessory protein PhoU n=1 Tax=bioreactor metagenome TaxID=1076179 RepID=A0A645BPY1_9ZZZZ
MRSRFDQQLSLLKKELTEMGALCEQAIAAAAKALLNRDMELAAQAIHIEEEIDRKERDIENLCLKLLLQQQPVARDLRLISAALKMITDMERIGDQAADIAEIISVAEIAHMEDVSQIGDMARATIKMVTDSVSAFVWGDTILAQSVIEHDDEVDALFRNVRDSLIAFIAAHPESGQSAIDLMMISKYFERIGDHAENIAEWVLFSVTGIHKSGPPM